MTDEEWRIEKEQIYVGGQGITKSERHWYYTATFWRVAKGFPLRIWREGYIFKMDSSNNKILAHRKIPFQELGFDHIGDIDFFNGLIYASLEDIAYSRPRIVLFDEKLSVRDYVDLSDQKHLPWCAVNPEDHLLLSSEYDPVKYVNFYEIKTQHSAKLVRRLKLSKILHNVQGGCMHEDELDISCNDQVKGIYRIDLNSGKVFTLLKTKIPYEMEGICADFNEKPVFHFIDHEGHIYHARMPTEIVSLPSEVTL